MSIFPVLTLKDLYSLFNAVYTINLGNDYVYLTENEEFDDYGYAGKGIYYNTTVPVIFPRVDKYAFDSTFITVKQKYDNKNSIGLMRIITFQTSMK